MPAQKRHHNSRFYRQFGQALRLARDLAGKSQLDVADHLDISFQQLQKYESGTNRMPVDRLVGLAKYLGVPTQHFLEFAELPDSGDGRLLRLTMDLRREDVRLFSAFHAMSDRQRDKLLIFIEELART